MKRTDSASLTFIFILALWFAVNVIQSIYTNLTYDEAYYWLFSKHLDWGYFDHPPMVALFIKVGDFLFSHELGVRISSVVAQVITLVLVWKIIDEKEPTRNKVILFFGISASIVMFQVYGFITTPDVPLLLFAACFLFTYKQFLKESGWINTILLSLSMAGLVYSKYHGGLVIIITILAHFRILLNVRFWIAGIFALALFTPHIFWQFSHDFPTFQYQMVSRLDPFSFKHFLSFWPNQFATLNPFTLGAVLFIVVKQLPKDTFERVLYFILIGFLLFFWMSTFWGHAEPQWTVVCSIPIIFLVYRYSVDHQPFRKYIYRFIFPTLLLLGIIRIILIFNMIPEKLKAHNQIASARDIEKISMSSPVIFLNSYQRASSYTFYTGTPSFSLNNIYHRKNQFDLWDYEEKYHGKKMAVVIGPNDSLAQRLPDRVPGQIYIHMMDSLVTVEKMQIHFSISASQIFRMKEQINIPVTLFNPYPYPIRFDDPGSPVKFSAVFLAWRKKLRLTATTYTEVLTILTGETIETTVRFQLTNIPAGDYQFGISLTSGIFPEAYNSTFEKVEIINN